MPSIAIIIPTRDDAPALVGLVSRLACLESFTLIVVDDGSTVAPVDTKVLAAAGLLGSVIRLNRNLGCQRAIAVGLCCALEDLAVNRIVVMDADGEDRPEDLPALLNELNGVQIVVAERGNRHESWWFRSLYFLYRFLGLLLTGERLRQGNFSAMTRAAAQRLSRMEESWLSLAGAILRLELPLARLRLDRGKRIAGISRMTLVSLITHGLTTIAVFADRVVTRLILLCGCIAAVLLLSFVVAIGLKFVGYASPGWLTTIGVAALAVLVQVGVLALVGLFILAGQKQATPPPPYLAWRTLIDRIEGFGP